MKPVRQILAAVCLLAGAAAAQSARPVEWRVNGILGGNASVGTITPLGVYTAPLAVPAVPTVTVRVTSVEDPSKWAEARVTIVLPPIDRVEIQPTLATVEVGKSIAFTQQVVSRGVPVPRTAAGYAPNVGIDMTAAGALEVFVPGLYEVGTFAHRLSSGNCTTTAGIPAVGVTFYEPCFGNASGAVEQHSATSVFDAFNVPLMILKVGIPGDADPNNRWDVGYSTYQRVSEDDAYIVVKTLGNSIDVLHFTGASAGQRAVSYSLGAIASSNTAVRWMNGAHKHKLVYQSGSNLRVFNVATGLWCTELSTDGLSDTCDSSSSSTNYHVAPVSGTWGIGGNEGDMSPGNLLPITKTGVSPGEIYVYDVVAKTSVQMGSVPTGSLDWAEISLDDSRVNARIGSDNYAWNAATGAILNGGAAIGITGHRAIGILPDGSNVLFSLTNDGTPPGSQSCNNGSFGPQRKSYKPFDAPASYTDLLEHASPRDPQTTCEDSHWSAHTTYPNPQHHLVAFDFESSNTVTDQADVSGGALGASWDNDWRYLSREIAVCDYANPASDPLGAPACWRVAHARVYDDARDCSACVNITRSGKYITFRSHLGTDISGAGARTYIVRVGPLR